MVRISVRLLLFDELRALVVWLREPSLWLTLTIGLTLWTLAYLQPYAARLSFGGDLATGRRFDDEPFVENFNAPEPNNSIWWERWHDLSPDQIYRWTRAESAIRLPGIGQGRWLVAFRALGQPTGDGASTISRWSDGTTTSEIQLTNQPRIYRILARSTGDDLVLHLRTQPFTAPSDPRELGFIAYHATIASAGGRAATGPGQLALLSGVSILIYGLARRLGLSAWMTLVMELTLALAIALVLARWRLALTGFTPVLLPLLLGCYTITVVADRLFDHRSWSGAIAIPGLSRRSPIARRASIAGSRPSVLGLVILAFVLRLGGELHPHTMFSDLGLHAHNLNQVTGGDIFFTEALPSEAGGGPAPYPPGQYLALLPLQLVLPYDGAGQAFIVKFGNALWDSLTVALIWLLLRGESAGGALLGAALYTVAPPLLNSVSKGEFANIFGQGMALPLLAVLSLLGDRLHDRRVWAFACALLSLALLGHLGVMISLALLLVCLALVWLASREMRPSFVALVLLGVTAGLFVGLCYYSVFGYLLAEQTTRSSTATQMFTLSEKIQHQIHDNRGISVLALTLGLIGALLLPMRGCARMRTRRLALLLAAWWSATVLSFGLLLFASQGIRWQHFLYPAVCLGGGIMLAALWRRGWAGRAIAVVSLTFLLVDGTILWIRQLIDYLHS